MVAYGAGESEAHLQRWFAAAANPGIVFTRPFLNPNDLRWPPLALALGASAATWLDLEAEEERLRDVFASAVASFDAADSDYRAEIERTLSTETAGTMLATMGAFRERVRTLRHNAREQIAELYRRYGATYGWFDPLNPFVPATTGLSHADGTRVATISDAVRSEADALRAQANGMIVSRLQTSEIEALRAAKVRRVAAFDAAIAVALEAIGAQYPEMPRAQLEKSRARLVELAEGWY